MSQASTASVVFIAKEPIKAGHAGDYSRIESQIAEVSARLHCPHPYLALERISGPTETWWLNTFESVAEKDRVEQAYAANTPFMTELTRLAGLKKPFIGDVVSVLATCRFDLSARAWSVEGARYFAVRATSGPESDGVVFEGDDGRFYAFTPARTADVVPGFALFAVKPVWSFPDDAWIDSDPAFWSESPAARIRVNSPNR